MTSSQHERPDLEGEAAWCAMAACAGTVAGRDPHPSVAHQAERLLLMGIAWSALGASTPESGALLRAAACLEDGGAATVIGKPGRYGWAAAAFLNAAHAQVYDCNDGFTGRGAWHPGRTLIPTALAAAECAGASGRHLIRALVAGYEIAARAAVDRPRNRSDGLGAAAVAGVLLGLSESELAHAMLLSEQHGPRVYPGPGNFHAEANHVSNGQIARVAVESAILAREGIRAHLGHETLLFDPVDPDLERPEDHAICQVYIKPQLSCRLCHSPIELALALRGGRAIRPDAIERIEVRIGARELFLAQRVPPDGNVKTAFFSIPHSIACVLLDGNLTVRHFRPEHLADRDVQALQAKVHVTQTTDVEGLAPGARYAAEMSVTFADGSERSLRRDIPTGDARNPLDDPALLALFRSWAGAGLAAERLDAIPPVVFGLETREDLQTLMAHLRSP